MTMAKYGIKQRTMALAAVVKVPPLTVSGWSKKEKCLAKLILTAGKYLIFPSLPTWLSEVKLAEYLHTLSKIRFRHKY